MGDHKAERLRERVLTRGEISLAQWHRMVRHIVFGAALALMSLSLVALHWALDLVGIPTLLAFAGAIFIEVGMACVASAATTIRKPREPGKDGEARDPGYYLSLWAIFSFMMLLAQGANVGHALVEVSGQIQTLPAWVPSRAVYLFAGAFAALFPLGGTLFVHVSGFLRAHGADANWIDPDAESVRVREDSTTTTRAVRPRASRANGRPTARDTNAVETRPPTRPTDIDAPPEPRAEPTRPVEYRRDPARQALFETYVERLRARPDCRPRDVMTTEEILASIGITDNGNARTIRGQFHKKAQARLAAEPPTGPVLVVHDGQPEAWMDADGVEGLLSRDREPEPAVG